MRKHGESIRIFKSDFLERFTHVHPITPLLVWIPVIGALIWRSIYLHGLSFGWIFGLAFLGVFTWTLMEYLLHRYVFHLTGKGKFLDRVQFIIHGLHHDDPNDPTRLVMPPLAAIVLATLLFILFRLILGPVWVEPFFAFFLVGYLAYDYTHYAVHHFTPRTRIGKYLKQSHMLHHFVTPNARWGVNSPLWDFFFGTLNERASRDSSATRANPRAST